MQSVVVSKPSVQIGKRPRLFTHTESTLPAIHVTYRAAVHRGLDGEASNWTDTIPMGSLVFGRIPGDDSSQGFSSMNYMDYKVGQIIMETHMVSIVQLNAILHEFCKQNPDDRDLTRKFALSWVPLGFMNTSPVEMTKMRGMLPRDVVLRKMGSGYVDNSWNSGIFGHTHLFVVLEEVECTKNTGSVYHPAPNNIVRIEPLNVTYKYYRWKSTSSYMPFLDIGIDESIFRVHRVAYCLSNGYTRQETEVNTVEHVCDKIQDIAKADRLYVNICI